MQQALPSLLFVGFTRRPFANLGRLTSRGTVTYLSLSHSEFMAVQYDGSNGDGLIYEVVQASLMET